MTATMTATNPTPPGGFTYTAFGSSITSERIVLGQPSTELKKKSPSRQKIYNLPLLEAFPGRLQEESGEVGIEIECEGTDLFSAPIKFWRCTSDGSLRPHGEHQPVEYVLRKPLSREAVPHALTYLSKKLIESGSNIDDSTRTSVHVHVNCQKMSIKDIYKYWCLYTVFEELLVNFSGPDRVGNLFCLRSKDAEHQVQIMEAAIQNESFNEMFSDNTRYTSCNTASLGKFGSLEFRSMRGTVDQSLIQTWIDILLRLRDKALEYDNPRDICKHFTDLGPEKFLNHVFCSPVREILLDQPGVYTMMWDGMRLMRDVAFSIKWEKYNPSIPKPKTPTNNRRLYSPCGRYYMSPQIGNRYFLVNVTDDILSEISDLYRTNPNSWAVSPGHKLEFRAIDNGYIGQAPASLSDLAPEVSESSGYPWINEGASVVALNQHVNIATCPDGSWWSINPTLSPRMITYNNRHISVGPRRAYKFSAPPGNVFQDNMTYRLD